MLAHVIKLLFAKILDLLRASSSHEQQLNRIETKLDRALTLLESISNELIPDQATNIELMAGPVQEQP